MIRCGIDVLLENIPQDLKSARVGLVAHSASMTSSGLHSAEACFAAGIRPSALFGPEHGFFGAALAGEHVETHMHSTWNIPIFSLYGDTRAPTAAMMDTVDVILFDIQTLACRAYTYVSTLRLVMEACNQYHKKLIVLDRPDALLNTVDGPLLEPACQSFVGLISTPFCYSYTLGETALFLKTQLELSTLELEIVACQHVVRGIHPETYFPTWHPPSPSIYTLENALCFPITVFFEALPLIDHARGTPNAFCCLSHPHEDIFPLLSSLSLPGIALSARTYRDRSGNKRNGVHIDIVNPLAYQPAAAAFAILQKLQRHFGRALWEAPETRPGFFDQLWGTGIVREQLMQGAVELPWTTTAPDFSFRLYPAG